MIYDAEKTRMVETLYFYLIELHLQLSMVGKQEDFINMNKIYKYLFLKSQELNETCDHYTRNKLWDDYNGSVELRIYFFFIVSDKHALRW